MAIPNINDAFDTSGSATDPNQALIQMAADIKQLRQGLVPPQIRGSFKVSLAATGAGSVQTVTVQSDTFNGLLVSCQAGYIDIYFGASTNDIPDFQVYQGNPVPLALPLQTISQLTFANRSGVTCSAAVHVIQY